MRRSTFWTVCIALASFFVFAEVVFGVPASPWVLDSNMITARDQFAGCVIDNKIYVFGGNNNPDGINLNSGEVYDINSSSWSSISPNNHTAGIEEVTGVAVNGKFYVLGESFNEVYDPESDTWMTLAPNPAGTSVTVPAVYDGKIYLFGGHGPDGPGGVTVHSNAVEVYNPVSNTWQSEANMPKTLGGPAIAVYNDSAYVIGGYDTNAKKMNTEVMVYNFISNIWTRNYCTAPSAVYSYCANSTGTQTPVVDGKAYLVGGVEGAAASNQPTNKFTIFDINNRQWQTGASLPEARAGNLTVADNNALFVIGGYAVSGNSNIDSSSKSTVYYLSNVTPISLFGNLSGSKNTKLAVNDACNVLVTFSITGGGYGEIIGDANFGQINLYNTTEKSQLTITSKTEISIGDINSNGPLKAITAKTAELSGSITIGSAENKKSAVTIVFDQGNGLDINSGMPIKSISACDWWGSLTAPSVGSITTKSNLKLDELGYLSIDVNAGVIGSVKVADGIDGSWDCYSVKSITASSIDDFYLTLSQEPNVKVPALGTLTVKNSFEYSRIISSGNIGTVTAEKMFNTSCFAGVDPTYFVDLNADGVLDLPHVFGDTFNQTATIKSIAIKGIKGEDPNFFINSNIAAYHIDSISVAYPQYNNGGVIFGITMWDNPAKTFTIKDANGTHSWKGSDIGSAGDWLTNLGYDMQIRRD